MSRTYQPLSKALACAGGLLHYSIYHIASGSDYFIETLISWSKEHSQDVAITDYEELISDCKNFYRTLRTDLFIARCVAVNTLTFMQPEQRWLIQELVTYYKKRDLPPTRAAEELIRMGLHEHDN